MITAIALDDETPALEIIETFSSQSDLVKLEATFTSTTAALEYLENNNVDLLFIDVQMPAITGINFIKQLHKKPLIIFTTSYSEYAVEGYNLDVLDYLLKPFTFKRFTQALEKAWELLQARLHTTPLVFRVNYGLVNIHPKNILYIEGLDNYLRIYTGASTSLVVRITMKEMEQKLPTNHFLRVHRSFIIALNKVTFFRNKTIFVGQVEIPLGKKYEPAFFQKYKVI